MRHVIYIALIINLLPAICCGQQIVWQNHYGGSGYETLLTGWQNNAEIIKNNDGDYIFEGHTSSFNVHANQYAFKIDDLGNLKWQFNVGHIYEGDIVSASIKTYDSNYFMIGHANFQSININDIRLTKFTEEGDIIFSKIILADSLYPVIAHDICYTADSNYIAACNSSYSIFLVKLNNNGDTLWTRTPLPDSLIYINTPLLFRPAPDYSAYYGVVRHGYEPNHYYWFKTDTAGQLLDLKEIKYPNQFDIIVYKAAILANGNMLILGGADHSYQQLCSPAGNFHFLFEYNSVGEIVRQKILCRNTWWQFEQTNANLFFDDFLATEDGTIYFSQSKRLFKLNANWEPEWCVQLGVTGTLLKLAQFEPGYLIAAGEQWINSEDSDIFMCKIALPEAIGMEEKEGFKFNVYPNPTTGQLILESSLVETTAYTILSIDGSLITQGSFTAITNVDLTTLSAGAYYLNLQDHEGNRVYGQVISKQ